MNIIDLIQKYLDDWQMQGEWDVMRTDRTRHILPMVLDNAEGDILEIGAHIGTTTRVLCELSAPQNRHVYVVDPWDGRQEGDESTYNGFIAHTAGLTNLTVYRHGSERPEVLELLRNKRFSYILIDGLHGYDPVRNDFLNFRAQLNDNGVICVDDWNGPYMFNEPIRRAILDNLTPEYHLLRVRNLIENYIVKVPNGQ